MYSSLYSLIGLFLISGAKFASKVGSENHDLMLKISANIRFRNSQSIPRQRLETVVFLLNTLAGFQDNLSEDILNMSRDEETLYIMRSHAYPDAWDDEGEADEDEIRQKIGSEISYFTWYILREPLEYWGWDELENFYDDFGSQSDLIETLVDVILNSGRIHFHQAKHLIQENMILRISNLQTEIIEDDSGAFIQTTASIPLNKVLEYDKKLIDIKHAYRSLLSLALDADLKAARRIIGMGLDVSILMPSFVDFEVHPTEKQKTLMDIFINEESSIRRF